MKNLAGTVQIYTAFLALVFQIQPQANFHFLLSPVKLKITRLAAACSKVILPLHNLQTNNYTPVPLYSLRTN